MTKQVRLVKPEPMITPPDLTLVMEAQREFCDKFGIPQTPETIHLYASLIEEEHEEWVEDYYSMESFEYQELKELADILYVTAGLAFHLNYNIKKAKVYKISEYYDYSITDLVSEIATGDISETTLSNLMYCLYGYADAMGWDLDEAYKRVHDSNLSKLGDDGKPVYRHDGKVLKGPNYAPPFLEDLTDGK